MAVSIRRSRVIRRFKVEKKRKIEVEKKRGKERERERHVTKTHIQLK
jgi:hypothetical protein